jgi:glycosyltransferase involved in cell wall biosynthesis
VVRHPYNKGNGASVKTAIRSSTTEWIAIVDGDGQHPSEDAMRLVSRCGEFDLVIGARDPRTQATSGRRVGRSCRKPTRSNRKRRKCTRHVLVGRFAQQSTAGANRKAFSGRIGRKRMKPGKHRASLVATDAAGNKSAPKRLNLRVVRR